ncbi:hypothetical protein [Puia sp.]|jgi:hypothetical protein|uniref:hypothetical protein n=1 Tax=Puia sp. TaxID=2045100 RepID=UPI002F3F9AEF
MLKIPALCGLALLCLALSPAHAQAVDSSADKVINFPTKLLGRIRSRAASLNDQLTRQTQRYLQKMARREERLRQKLATTDSSAAKQLFANSAGQYAALGARIQTDSGSAHALLNGTYQPYLDSLQGSVAFLKQNPQLLTAGITNLSQLQGAGTQLQALQAKMQDADLAKAYVQQRKQQIGAYLAKHADLQPLLGKTYAGMQQDVYYYSQQLRQYKEMWNNPDQLEQKALSVLGKLPAFQTFMQQHSQLAGLFRIPGNYGSAASLSGLQTKEQVAEQIQNQVKAGGAGGDAALQSSLQSANSQLDDYKSKLSTLGAGNGNADMPDFTPNDQKTKTIWRRLEYGVNFQTTRNNYMFPTVTDFGFSLGYKLGHNNIIGVGASYKLGWGNGIQHIAFSSEGIGLRSFLQIRIKGTFSASGGFEYNYTTPFTSYQQLKQLEYWTKSGLIGVTKTVSTKSKVFKKTNISLLWDFLSYQAVPKTQPIVFRVGYSFN